MPPVSTSIKTTRSRRRRRRSQRLVSVSLFLSTFGRIDGFVFPQSNVVQNHGLSGGTTEDDHNSHVILPAKRKNWHGVPSNPKGNDDDNSKESIDDENNATNNPALSRNRAISALSKPSSSTSSLSATSSSNDPKRYVLGGKGFNRSSSSQMRNIGGRNSNSRRRNNNNRHGIANGDNNVSFSSLLPPPIKSQSGTSSKKDKDRDPLSEGLSSWEDFLGGRSPKQKRNTSRLPKKGGQTNKKNPNNNVRGQGTTTSRSQNKPTSKKKQQKKGLSSKSFDKKSENLPSIADLFPPDLSEVLDGKNASAKSLSSTSTNGKDPKSSSTISPPPPSLDGVLPVSDLFYRSAQSMNEDDESTTPRDDEELPFSAEQSNTLTTDHNKIRIRRNQSKPSAATTTPQPKAQRQNKRNNNNKRLNGRRKMVRRGMEMLVGGVPINADPPQRSAELFFQHEDSTNWHEVVSLSLRDFGPMLYSSSVGSMSKIEQGLFCEHFASSTMKWDVCPQDLKTIVNEYTSSLLESASVATNNDDDKSADTDLGTDENVYLLTDNDEDTNSDSSSLDAERELHRNYLADLRIKHESGNDSNLFTSELPGLGFGTLTNFNNPANDGKGEASCNKFDPDNHLGGELVFSIGVSKEELESADSPSKPSVLERVLARGIIAATGCNSFDASFRRLILVDMDDGTTMVSGDFALTVKDNENMTPDEVDRKAKGINSSLAQAMDDGDMILALAAAAKDESEWSQEVRDRVVEEFLFEDDDGDGPLDEEEDKNEEEHKKKEFDVIDGQMSENSGTDLHTLQDFIEEGEKKDSPLLLPDGGSRSMDDIFLGGGDDGVFWNYSEKNEANSPYGGALGLRLVDAVVHRAKERSPRVIAIGDVHGCIDELQDLLRECDYRPGDLVVFLGDLVSKGPDSISVVQMAREIGAIGVRGNHDFEVIRWHQAILSGVDPPVVGSEHFHIASCLTKADMKWMYSLPWYLSSKHLGALFVHAGFVSGIRLGKQNPRLMMNMRSILPDGTVTSKFFNNWPWARLWDGPQTVLFGHDADRGLQQYEHAIGLDTGCVYGGRLTACILPEKRLVSVSARREYFKYRRKHYD